MSWRMRQAAQRLWSGGIVAYPTEAVYGLGCDPFNQRAVQHLLELKQRPASKGLILLASDFDQIEACLDLTPALRQRLLAAWPGPVTWVTPANPELPDWLTVNGSVAVRVTAHPLAAALCRAFGGPLVSTSANPGGKRPARNPLNVRRYFPNADLLILHGETGGENRPTAIYNALNGKQLR